MGLEFESPAGHHDRQTPDDVCRFFDPFMSIIHLNETIASESNQEQFSCCIPESFDFFRIFPSRLDPKLQTW